MLPSSQIGALLKASVYFEHFGFFHKTRQPIGRLPNDDGCMNGTIKGTDRREVTS